MNLQPGLHYYMNILHSKHRLHSVNITMANRLSMFLRLLPLLLIFKLNNGIIFKMTNVVCESHNKSVVQIETCRLRAVQRNKTVLNIIVNLLEPIKSATLQLHVMKRASGFKPWVINGNFDLCKLMRSRKDTIGKLLFDLIGEFTTLNHPCPYWGKQSIKDFYPIAEKLPLSLPTGDYLILLTWKLNGNIVDTNVYFSFVENLLKMF